MPLWRLSLVSKYYGVISLYCQCFPHPVSKHMMKEQNVNEMMKLRQGDICVYWKLNLRKLNLQLVLYLVSILKLHGHLHMHAHTCIPLGVQINFHKIPWTEENILFIISHYWPNKYELKTWRSFHVYLIR